MHLHGLIDIFLGVVPLIHVNLTVLGEVFNHFFGQDVPLLRDVIFSFGE
jgi:hypothetical protein